MRIWRCLALLAMVAVPALPAYSQSSSYLTTVVVPLASAAGQAEVLPGAEATLLSLINQVRRAHRLPALRMDPTLRQVARKHSRDMATRGFVGHAAPGGTSFADRLVSVVSAGTLVGENVTLARSVEQAHSAFVASPPHRQNLLEPRFRRVGIGIAGAADLGLFVTQDFAQ